MATLVHGIAIRPGISRNGRRYTVENCQKAYDRLTQRLTDTGRPVTMRVFHPTPGGPGGDVRAIVGRVTKATLTTDGAIAYEAILADTAEAKTVATLVKPDKDGRQHLANVSIRGYWIGETRVDEQGFTCGDDLEIDGIDLTDTPGITTASVAPGPAEADGRTPITESVEEAFVDMTVEESSARHIFEDGCCSTCGY